jgi:hypothetical protein
VLKLKRQKNGKQRNTKRKFTPDQTNDNQGKTNTTHCTVLENHPLQLVTTLIKN